VAGDLLCTSRQGCGAVLADGRVLNIVRGEPPRPVMTLVAEPPAGGG
jgi:hypothetical protein